MVSREREKGIELYKIAVSGRMDRGAMQAYQAIINGARRVERGKIVIPYNGVGCELTEQEYVNAVARLAATGTEAEKRVVNGLKPFENKSEATKESYESASRFTKKFSG